MPRTARQLCLWGFCLIAEATFAAPTPDFVDLHRLTAAELQALPQAESTPVQLVLAASIGQRDIDAGIAHFKDTADAISNLDETVYFHAGICGLYLRAGDVANAEQACQPLPAHLENKTLHPSVAAFAYGAIGALETRKGQSEHALECFEAGLEAATVAGDRIMLALLYHNRSVPLMDIGLSDLAIRTIESAQMHLSEVPQDATLPDILLHNLALIQARRGSHEAALKQYTKAAEMFTKLDQSARLFIVNTQIAISLTALGRSDEAIQTLQPWVEREGLVVTTDSRIAALRALGDAHRERGEFAVAARYLQTGLELAVTHNNPLQIRQTNLSLVELALGEGKTNEAIATLERLLTHGTDPRLEATALRLTAQAHALQGNFQAAWRYQSDYIAADQALRNTDFDDRLAALTSLNEKNQLRQALRTARAEEDAANMRSAQSRTLLLAGFAVLGVVALLGVLLMRRSIERRRNAVQQELYEQLEDTVQTRTQDLRKEMTRRLAAEKSTAEMEKRLIEDDKLRSIGQLTGGVAHDFNNLLTVISLSCDLLRVTDEDKRAALLDDIERASESGQAITQSLMAYARQQTLSPETINLDQFLEEYAALFKRTLGDGIDLEIQTTPAAILADPGQLTTALLNLLFNAREAMQGSGSVHILLECDAKMASISVRDNGPGMSEQVLEHATEPFFTTKADGGGSGLGLSMAYGFVKQSGGDVTIESRTGVHTTVKLSFPLIESRPQAFVRQVDLDTRPFTEARALVVDDQPDVRNLCHAVLERMNIEVVEAVDGRQALQRLRDDPGFDLLITDMLMPGGMTGLDLIHSARDFHPDLPVVLISGGQVETPANCIFLAKPFKLKQMQEAVLTLLSTEQVEAS